MRDGVVATGFQNIIEADDIRLYIRIRVLYRVPHACLRRQVHHHLWLILLEDLVDYCLVCKISFHEGVVDVLGNEAFEFLQSPFL